MIKFTKIELELIELVPFDDKIDSAKLTELIFGKSPPINARPIIIGRLRSIAKKAEAIDLEWRLLKTHRSGPRSQQFWREIKQ